MSRPTSPCRWLATLALAAASPLALALDTQTVLRPDGRPIFTLRYFGPGDGPMMHKDDTETYVSTWTLDAEQKHKVHTAMRYWGEVLRPAPDTPPAIINIGAIDDDNAFGSSPSAERYRPMPTQFQAVLTGLDPGELTFGSHAQFVMGRMAWDTVPLVLDVLPRTGHADLSATALHELAHGLGVLSSASEYSATAPSTFAPVLTKWDTLLRDDHDRPARAGQLILCSLCSPHDDAHAFDFDVRQDRAVLAGPHIDAVLEGAMRGVPVTFRAQFPNGASQLDAPYFSHLELKRSTMSHQDYRNYTAFMEAELAVLQDLGYDIDRRNHFGRSVYGSGLTVQNDRGFHQRNADGTAYLPGTYNPSMLGMGLHVYGDRNTVHQQADLLTRGPGAAGARIDGENNHLVVEPGVRIHADGDHGRGVLFAYGRDHRLTLRGEVRATGPGGIGVSADFGHNNMGDAAEYRGSYLRNVDGRPYALLPELEGPLVSQMDLTGHVAGRAAAIQLSANGLVDRINIMRGARIEGDIVSEYPAIGRDGSPRLTELTFGSLSDTDGRATPASDPGFALRYDGSIRGDNLSLSMLGGHTALNGTHRVHRVQVMSGASLGGDSRYVLPPGQVFANDGLLSPGNSLGRIDIDGDYRQGRHGVLRLDVAGDGQHDTLAVSGRAYLDGELAIAPQAGWYANQWRVSQNSLLRAGSISGRFTQTNIDLASPTLNFAFQPTADGSRQLVAWRAADAYGQHGRLSNERRVGQALDRIVGHARPDIQPLYQALDFSAADGSQVGPVLSQLSGSAYSAVAAAGLARDRHVAEVATAQPIAMAAGTGWQAYAAPYALSARQRARSELSAYRQTAYGAVLGAQTQRDAWTYGYYGAIGEQRMTLPGLPATRSRATAFHLGAYAQHAADERMGPYYAAQAQVGLERGRLDRMVQWPGQTARHHGRWTGYTANLSVQTGYRWTLSPTVSAGPVAALSYAYLRRPALTETGGGATRLRLAATGWSSLRASLGLVVDAAWQVQAGGQAGAHLSLAWEHELLDRRQAQHAHFADYAQDGFATRHRLTRGDALHLRAGLRYQPRDTLRIQAGVGTRLLRQGYRELAGDMAVQWRF